MKWLGVGTGAVKALRIAGWLGLGLVGLALLVVLWAAYPCASLMVQDALQ